MFIVSGNSISLISGDDGVLVVHPRNIALTSEDYAILSVRKITSQGARGELLVQMIEQPDLENNRYIYVFPNKDTVEYPEGEYQWQIEFVFQNEHRIMSPGKFTVEKAVSQE